MRKTTTYLGYIAIAATILLPPVHAQSNLDSLLFTEIARGLANATSITHAGDGSGRLFITEQIGRIMILDGGTLQDVPFLDISDRVRAGGERGLLSAAFHPDYSSNGYLFVNYTDRNDDTVVSRFSVTSNPNLADRDSETVFFQAIQPRRNHNGGQIHFGPDDFLYIAMGDGGGAGDPFGAGQDLTTVLGKMLRVDIDNGAPATAPDSNPFVAKAGAEPEIWAYGLRNPWKFSFDRMTGDMFIADVGQNRREEISFQPANSTGGENYGWRRMEGSLCFRPSTNCNDGSLVEPIVEYENDGGNCGGSVTGGYRYRGARFPQLTGIYFFADYCTGHFYGAVEESGSWQRLGPRETAFNIRTFGEDETGEVYFADPSVLYRVEAVRPLPSISRSGVVNSATLQAGAGLAPGSLATAFGIGLAESTESAPGYPLPVELGGGSMTFNGSVPAPQLLASFGQRNFQIPWELGGLAKAKLTVTVGDETSAEVVVPLTTVSPGLYALDQFGQAAAFVASTGQLAAAPGRGFLHARPARTGEAIAVYATGLGPVTDPPATGMAALADPPSLTVNPVSVRVGDISVPASFSGLAPSFAGLYRVEFTLADSVPTGSSVPLAVQIGGLDSNTAFIAIESPPAEDPSGGTTAMPTEPTPGTTP